MRIKRVFTLPREHNKPRKGPFKRLASCAGFVVYSAVILSQAGIVLAQSNGLAAKRPSTASSNASTASSPSVGAAPDVAARARVGGAYGRLPLSFEPNRGQADARVQFLSRAPGFTLFLTGNNEAVLKLRRQLADRNSKIESRNSESESRTPNSEPRVPAVLRMSLVGGNRAAEIAGVDELPGKSNYFIGRDPEKWRTGIPNYRKVAARGVYPGIDLVYYGNQRQLEYDFTVAPGADPRAIRLALEIADGKTETGNSKLETRLTPESVRIDANGDLVIALDGGELRFHKPVVYQEQSAGSSSQLSAVSGQQTVRAGSGSSNLNSQITHHKSVEGRFVLLAKNLVGFEIGPYDRTRPLIIDPVLSYSTYLGGSEIDIANSIAVSSDGSAFIAGETDSLNFPVAHAMQPNAGGPFDFPDDAFVAKISPDGSTLYYSTYLGGAREDRANGIAVDTFGNAYVTGTTISEDFPASIGAADPNCGNDGHCDRQADLVASDAFATKLNPEGSAIVYSTYISHLGVLLNAGPPPVFSGANDRGLAIAVDLNGVAYVVGTTDAADPFGPFPGLGNDCFLAKISATGSSFLFTASAGQDAADFGGVSEDQPFGVAVENLSGIAYVTGVTYSPDFPGCALAGDADAIAMKINTTLPVAGSIVYSRCLGGGDRDQGNGVAIDAGGNAYVVGVTNSTDFPTTPGVVKPACDAAGDVFVTKLDSTASFAYSTCLGGSGADFGAGIALDSATNAYITGFTNSRDFPTKSPSVSLTAFQDTYAGGNTDAFVTKLNPTATPPLVYSSFLGGSNAEQGHGVAVDDDGTAYVAGGTCSTDFPPKRALQATSAGNCDAFISKVIVGSDIAISPTVLSFTSDEAGTLPKTITVKSNGDSPLTITEIAISPGFTETHTCEIDTPMAVGTDCQINVIFAPTTPEPTVGEVTITDDALGSPHKVSLNGATSGVTGDYSLSADPRTVSIFAGSTGNVALEVTPASGFTGQVALTCTGAPRNTVCTVNPASVTLDGANPSAASVSVQTTARVQAPPGWGPNSLPPAKGYRWLPWAFLLMVLVTLGANRQRRTAIILSVVILMALLWTACGGGGEVGVPNGTPAGSYTLTITGVSGTTTKTTAVTLIVN